MAPPSTPTTSLARLSNIRAHMDASNPTVFHADHVPQAPEDPLFGLMAAYRKDDYDKKVDLGIGAYRDDHAKPWVLPVVKKVRPYSSQQIRGGKMLTIHSSRRTNCCEKTQI